MIIVSEIICVCMFVWNILGYITFRVFESALLKICTGVILSQNEILIPRYKPERNVTGRKE